MPNNRREEDPAVVDPRRQFFQYTQKISQAFIHFPRFRQLDRGDIFIAYCHADISGKPYIIGAQTYTGDDYTTVPVMGSDRPPYQDNFFPMPVEDDGLIYCARTEQIFVSVMKRNGRRLNLNSVPGIIPDHSTFFIPKFYDG